MYYYSIKEMLKTYNISKVTEPLKETIFHGDIHTIDNMVSLLHYRDLISSPTTFIITK